ncbi:MAG: Uncharacterized protein LiPW39_83 [Parcubacteria group bacterium LiPW_39]|nr:MAG: Uncharacterized protein LiPW39_83 [Parcubacteria group bacterium LiPW_39]
MICPKCKAEDQWGNFCSNCGQKLKEKCPECGWMERIGRKVCTTKVKEVREKLQEYQNLTVGNWRIILSILLTFTSTIALGVALIFTITAYPGSPIANLITWEMMLPIDFSIFGFIVYMALKGSDWQWRVCDRAQENFFQLHPDYAELLKKTEEG